MMGLLRAAAVALGLACVASAGNNIQHVVVVVLENRCAALWLGGRGGGCGQAIPRALDSVRVGGFAVQGQGLLEPLPLPTPSPPPSTNDVDYSYLQYFACACLLGGRTPARRCPQGSVAWGKAWGNGTGFSLPPPPSPPPVPLGRTPPKNSVPCNLLSIHSS